jgi:hypothetical protein
MTRTIEYLIKRGLIPVCPPATHVSIRMWSGQSAKGRLFGRGAIGKQGRCIITPWWHSDCRPINISLIVEQQPTSPTHIFECHDPNCIAMKLQILSDDLPFRCIGLSIWSTTWTWRTTIIVHYDVYQMLVIGMASAKKWDSYSRAHMRQMIQSVYNICCTRIQMRAPGPTWVIWTRNNMLIGA